MQKEQTMSKKTTRREYEFRVFVRWLKEKQIYHKYVRGVAIHFHISEFDGLRKVKMHWGEDGSTGSINNIIDASLWWSQTYEGHSFWCVMNEEWNRFYRKMKTRDENKS